MEEKKILVDIEINSEDIKKAQDAMSNSAKSAALLTLELNKLKEEQKKNNAEAKAGTISATELASRQAGLKLQMTETSKALSASNKEYANNKTVVDAAKGSNDQLKARLSLLTKELNGMSDAQRFGTKEGKQLSATVDTLTDKLKGNEKAVGDNRRNVGNYTDSIKEAAIGSGSFGKGLVGMVSGLKSATIASLKFLATPIGAVIGAVGISLGLLLGGFKLMSASLNRTEDGAAALSGVMNVFKGVMNGVLAVVEPIALFLVEGLADGFEVLGEMVETSSKQIEKALRFLGFEDAANGLAKVTAGIKETSIATAQLAKAEAELNKIQRQQGILQLEAQNRAEKLRQIRDDESKSIKERIQANKDLSTELTNQSDAELKLANRALEIANLRIKADGASTENLDKLAEAELKIAEIEERITSQRSEQMTNENSLRRDGVALVKEANDKIRKLSEEQIKAEEKAAEASAKIREDFRVSQLTDIEKRKEDALNKANQLREAAADEKEVQSFLSQELLEIHRAEQDIILNDRLQAFEDEAQAARSKVESEIESEGVRKVAIMAINEEVLLAKQQTLDLEIMNYQASTDALGFIDEERSAKLLIEKGKVDAELVKIDDEKTAALNANTKSVQDAQSKMLSDGLAAAQGGLGALGGVIDGFQQTLEDNIKNIEEQGKAAGKTQAEINKQTRKARKEAHDLQVAAAIVQTLQAGIAAYQSGASVPIIGVALGPIMAAAALAFGFSNVAKMKQEKPKFARGTILQGASHNDGGIQLHSRSGHHYGEAEGGEIILAKGVNANPRLRAEASRLNVLGGGVALAPSNYMELGGIASPTFAARQTAQVAGLTRNDLSEALSSMPAPIVTVSDINRVQGQVASVSGSSNL
jgi:hypothetical protein